MGFLLSLIFIIGCIIISKLLGGIFCFVLGWTGRLFILLFALSQLVFLKEIHSILLGIFLIANVLGFLCILYEYDISRIPILKRKSYNKKALGGMYSGLVLFICVWTLFTLGKSIQYLDFLTRGWQVFSGIILLLAGWCVAILGLDDSNCEIKGQFACPMQVEFGGNVVLYENFKNKFDNLSEFYNFASKKNLKELKIFCEIPESIGEKFRKFNNDADNFNIDSSSIKETDKILSRLTEIYSLLDVFYDKILDIVQKNLNIKKDDAFRDVNFSRMIENADNSPLLFLGGNEKTLVYAIFPESVSGAVIVIQGEKATEENFKKMEEEIVKLKINFDEYSEFTFEMFNEDDYFDVFITKISTSIKQNDGIWFKEKTAKLLEKYNLKRNARQGIIDTAYIIKYDWLRKWTNAISFSIPNDIWLDFGTLSMKLYNKFLRLSTDLGGCLKVRDDVFGVPCCALICAEDVAVAYGTGEFGEKMIMWQTRLPNQSKIVELCIKKHLIDSFFEMSFAAENIQLHSNQNGFELKEQKFIDKFLIEISEENDTPMIESPKTSIIASEKNSSENVEEGKPRKPASRKKTVETKAKETANKNTNSDASLKKLEKIHSMFEKGLITKEEFEKKKMELLADI